ncbi:MAG TPA: hypothetical protein VNE63_00595 [Candidatus Acidoferrales bacterium]|nr:hypothetical protein [Candidatus Acidoferrales bacterium]
MAETQKAPYPWPRNSWVILTKIIRAWYTFTSEGGEVTGKKIADTAGVHASQISTNRPFLVMLGVVNPEGTSLTEAGKRIGIGLYNDNESMRRQGFELVVKSNPLLSDMLNIIKGRGGLKEKDFSDEIALRTNGKTEGFGTGVGILREILISSGLVEAVGDSLQPVKNRIDEATGELEKPAFSDKPVIAVVGLKRIPIPVSTSSVWWIEVGENPADGEVVRFLEMQRLMFGIK